MVTIQATEGKYYTQAVGGLATVERVFFKKGLVAKAEDFRLATDEEIEQREIMKGYKTDCE